MASNIPKGVFRICFAVLFGVTFIIGLYAIGGSRVERPIIDVSLLLLMCLAERKHSYV